MGYVSTLSNSLPQIRNDRGEDLYLVDIVEDELSAWDGKKENDWGMGSFLQKYWSVTPYPEYANTDKPWSAAFISWILEPYGFKGEAGHTSYADNVIAGDTKGWEAFSLVGADKVRLNVGDVLIYDREPSDGTSRKSHGDVVYEIKDGFAWLVGGNLSDSVNVADKIPVDQDGFATDVQPYQIILKNLNPGRVWPRYLYWISVVGWYGFLFHQYSNIKLGRKK